MVAVLAGIFLVQADLFASIVAMPAIQLELGLDGGSLQFLLAGFLITNASLLITSGRLGDLYGSRRMYLIGLGLFCLTSLGAACATDLVWLVVARTLQGAAAACIQPHVLGILARTYPGEASRRAFAAYAVSMGLGSVAGQILGGLMLAWDGWGLGWRGVFLCMVPAALACIAIGWIAIPRRLTAQAQALDGSGVAFSIVLLTLITAPLTIGRSMWPLGTSAAMLAAVPLVGYLFYRHQRALDEAGRSQMLPIRLLLRRSTRIDLLAVFAFFCGVASFHVLQTLYLQQVQGASALESGLVFSATALGFMLASAAAPALARRLRSRAIVLGAIVIAASHVWNLLGARWGFDLTGLAAAIFTAGLGLGLVMGPLISRVLARVPLLDAGALSGLLATLQAAANAVGVAFVPLPFVAAMNGSAAERVAGYSASMAALICLAVAVAGLTSLRRRD
ncbi:MAG: MFS transporter [Rubrivivax sp.]